MCTNRAISPLHLAAARGIPYLYILHFRPRFFSSQSETNKKERLTFYCSSSTLPVIYIHSKVKTKKRMFHPFLAAMYLIRLFFCQSQIWHSTFHIASSKNHRNVLRHLLDSGIALNIQNEEGELLHRGKDIMRL